MNKKPGAFWHMMSWGVVSGTILGALFLMFFLLLDNLSISEVLGALPFLGFFGLIFGGVPGAILGLIEAFFVENSLSDIPDPFTKEDMKDRRWSVYWSVFPVPIVASIILSLLFWFIGGDALGALIYWFIFGIPTIIASIASAYVAHRYMFRLRLWSESRYARKPKMKNELQDTSRLLDNYENYEDILPESEQKSKWMK